MKHELRTLTVKYFELFKWSLVINGVKFRKLLCIVAIAILSFQRDDIFRTSENFFQKDIRIFRLGRTS